MEACGLRSSAQLNSDRPVRGRQAPPAGVAGACRRPFSARLDCAACGLAASVADSDRGNLSPQLQQEMQRLNGSSVLRVGIPWDPIEFIGKAGKLGHPFHQLSKINKPLEDLIDLLVQKPTAVRSRRRTFIDRWARRAKELAPEEAKLKAGMSEHCQKILAPKRILLFKEMLEDIQYDDLGVVQELIDGATLTGDIPVTGVLDAKLKTCQDRY